MKTEGNRRRKRGSGTQLDSMKRIRKEMSPPTKVMRPKKHQKPVNNWKDYLDDDADADADDYNGFNI